MDPVDALIERRIVQTRLGFSFKRCGTHLSRTMMLAELTALLERVDNPEAGKNEFREAIIKYKAA